MRITIRVSLLLACCLSMTPAAQSPPQIADGHPELVGLLDIEGEHAGDVPRNWVGTPPGTFVVDGQIVHGGQWSLRIERKDTSPGTLTSLSRTIPIDFAGRRLELRGFLRTEEVSNFAGLWMREDSDAGMIAIDNMEKRQLKGTTDWTEYSVSLPLNRAAKRLKVGVLVAGTGRTWADDLRLLVDGQPIASVPRLEALKTVMDFDKEFDGGSGVALKELSKTQISNLAMLGKVWGFLKYHHPLVTGGKRHWDYELFRILPGVLAASDAAAARAAVNQWIASLGPVTPCGSCASLVEADLQLHPPVSWMTDEQLGAELAATLRGIYRSRPSDPQQFYVSLTPGIGNPSFDHELSYATLKLPDAGYQVLALYRFWNIVQYWFPYRDVIGGSWEDVLTAFIPRVALAADNEAYKREMLALIASVNDTHANLWSSLDSRPPVGACRIPITLRFVRSQAVVTGYSESPTGVAASLRPGDVVRAIDSVAVTELVTRWSPYYAASNEPARLVQIAQSMTRGACGPVVLTVSRDGKARQVKAVRTAPSATSAAAEPHDHPGDTFRMLSPEVAYLKLSSVKAADAASYIESAAGAKGLIIDIRNYPSDSVVFALGSRFVDRPTPFVRFTTGDVANPGAFHWSAQPLTVPPVAPRYAGKIVILTDEVSGSAAEYTAMAFRAAPNATVIGSTTAGADGNASAIPLPGGLRSMISGIGVFYPDKKPTQRVGIIPDIEAKPTIQGIRSGRDEVLEAALRHILGPDAPAALIQQMAKR